MRPQAFLPRRGPQRLELSVFRIDGLGDGGVWDHAAQHAPRPGRNLHGRADFHSKDVTDTGTLDLKLDNSPPRHGNIVGWPGERDERLRLAQHLAERARGVPRQPG